MRLLPYRRFVLQTSLAPEEVVARLRDATEQSRSFGWSKPTRPLVGSVGAGSFEVMRNVAGRNSFRPRVRGTIDPAGSGTYIRGTMQLSAVVIAFVGVYVFGAGSVFLWAAVRSVTTRQLEPAMLPALGVLVFLIALTLGAFALEVRRSFKELIRLVDASQVTEL